MSARCRMRSLHCPTPLCPAESSSDSVANAATLTITVLAVVGVLVGGGATIKYFFGP